MQSALERRQQILELLSIRRTDSVSNLATEFGVSTRTVRRDIELLSCSAPLYTVQGKGGGIRVADGWYISRQYLNAEQEHTLRCVKDKVSAEEWKNISSILIAFAMPKTPENNGIFF